MVKTVKEVWCAIVEEEAFGEGHSTGAGEYDKHPPADVGEFDISLDYPMEDFDFPVNYTLRKDVKGPGMGTAGKLQIPIGYTYKDGNFPLFLQTVYFLRTALSGSSGSKPNSFCLHYFDGVEDWETYGNVIKEYTLDIKPDDAIMQTLLTTHYDTAYGGDLAITGSTSGTYQWNTVTTPKFFKDASIALAPIMLVEDADFEHNLAHTSANQYWSINDSTMSISGSNLVCVAADEGDSITAVNPPTFTAAPYTVLVHCSAYTQGDLYINCGGVGAEALGIDAVGWHTIQHTAAAAASLVITGKATTDEFTGSIDCIVVYLTSTVVDLEEQEIQLKVTNNFPEKLQEVASDQGQRLMYLTGRDSELTLTTPTEDLTLWVTQFESAMLTQTHYVAVLTIGDWKIAVSGIALNPEDTNTNASKTEEFQEYAYVFKGSYEHGFVRGY